MTRRQLSDEERVQALYSYYIGSKDLGTIAKELNCSIYDLSPWITSVATRIICGLEKSDPSLYANIKLMDAAQNISDNKLLQQVAMALRHSLYDHEIDHAFLHVADINYREALDLIEDIVKCSFPTELKDADSPDALALVEAVVRAQHFLADETPTDTEDRYTEGVMGDGAVFLKDNVPLTITQVLDILNGRTRR